MIRAARRGRTAVDFAIGRCRNTLCPPEHGPILVVVIGGGGNRAGPDQIKPALVGRSYRTVLFGRCSFRELIRRNPQSEASTHSALY